MDENQGCRFSESCKCGQNWWMKSFLCPKTRMNLSMEFFCCESKVQLDHKYKVVHAMVRFLYFGGLPMDTLTSLDCLDLLGLADDVEVGRCGKGKCPFERNTAFFRLIIYLSILVNCSGEILPKLSNIRYDVDICEFCSNFLLWAQRHRLCPKETIRTTPETKGGHTWTRWLNLPLWQGEIYRSSRHWTCHCVRFG